ncbi:hypothetical protein [Streptomyces sp. SID13031]|uniref:hypothetical protein n=1 Tax=Streptomyces sp. SID13031 TaxID=2706046 RepID=UPI0013CC5CF5|nr:hypothetical protein [Streptomyces sp. SID13031]NEA35113.1 hypothetical protein [Streptomyces sp. SID13031]
MDDVKKLLVEFADRAVDGIPAADVDADVARGRRALRRIRARRRVTGVLCIAAVSTAVLAIGHQVKWWGSGQAEVAGGSDEAASAAGIGPDAATPSQSPNPADADSTMSIFGAPAAVSLIANTQAWSNISCTLAPEGWAPRQPVGIDHVLLAPPTMRTATLGPNDGLEVEAVAQARTLDGTRVTESAGKVFHLGSSDGRETGQLLLGERWLLVQLPAGNKDWNDDLLRRFMASCTVN